MSNELSKEVADPKVCVFSGYAMYQALENLKGMETWDPDQVSTYVTQADLNLGKMEACGLKVDLEVKEVAQNMLEIAQGTISDDEKLIQLKREVNSLDAKIWNMLGKSS